MKVIIDHYQDKIKKMDNQMGAIELHFSSKYLTDHPNFVIKPILKKPSLSKFASFYAVLFNILNRGSSIKPSTRLDVYSKADLSYIYKFQMLILSHIRYGYLDDIRWSYDILTEHQVLFKEAFLEITYWIEKLCYLANISYQVPELIMHALDGYKVRLEEDRDNKQTFVIINRPIDYIQSELWISDLVTYHILPYHQEHQKALYELLFWIFNFPNFRDGQIPNHCSIF